MTRMEHYMSAVDDQLSQLDQATNDVASELESLKAEVANSDATLAAKLDAPIARLKSLAADPNNPVPADGTTAAAGTGAVANPAPVDPAAQDPNAVQDPNASTPANPVPGVDTGGNTLDMPGGTPNA